MAIDIERLLQLWNFADPKATRDAFLALGPETADERALVLSQIARTHSLIGEFDDANARLDEAEALGSSDPTVLAYLAIERGRTHNSAGDATSATALFEHAFELFSQAGAEAAAIDAAHMVAISGSPAQQIEWARKGLELAEASSDARARRWRGPLLNNLGWSLHDQGRFDEALQAFVSAQAVREESAEAEPIAIAKWSVARCLRSLGRVQEAIAIQRALLPERNDDGFVHEELGELLTTAGDHDEARAHFARAHELLSPLGWVEADRLERIKQLSLASPPEPGTTEP